MSAHDSVTTVSLKSKAHAYHLPSCQKYDPSHPIVTVEEAQAMGAKLCRVCGEL